MTAIETFVSSLRDSQILDDNDLADLERWTDADRSSLSVEEFANMLVEQELITPFQANELLVDRGEHLRMGQYVLHEMIGQGGMGQIYLAQHTVLKRRVAIKVLPPEHQITDESTLRFDREIEAAAKLSHPNVVTTHDAGRQGETRFLVMEYIQGIDLQRLVREQGVIAVEKAIAYVRQAAEGLSYLHQQRIVHRDVKPSNLMLNEQGVVKVLDVGLAKVGSVSGLSTTMAKLTDEGAVLGTIDFMAPEQARNTLAADHRADIYGLGCTLFYLLTGKRLYEGRSVLERIRDHKNKPIPKLGDVNPVLPVELDLIFRHMVAKRPDDRFDSMVELGNCLDDFLGHLESKAQGESDSTTKPTFTPAFLSSRNRRLQPSPFWRRRRIGIPLVMAGMLALGWLAWSYAYGLYQSFAASDVNAATVIPPTSVRENSLDPTTPNEPSATAQLDPQRAAAQHVLELGGVAKIRMEGSDQDVSKETDLPKESFRLVGISLSGTQVGNDDVTSVQQLNGLESLALNDTSVTLDAVLATKDALPSTHIDYDSPSFDQSHQNAAEWILKEKGWMRILTDGETIEVGASGRLPDGPFRLISVSLHNKPGIADADLARFAELYTLNDVQGLGSQIGDEGIRHFQNLWNLRHVDLWRTRVTATALEYLSRCHELRGLNIGYTGVRSGFWRIGRFTDLTELDITNTWASDAQIQNLIDLRNLKQFYVWQTHMTSQSTETLLGFSGLESFWASSASFDGKRLGELAALKNLKAIALFGRFVTPQQLTQLNSFPALEHVGVSAGTDEHLAVLGSLGPLNQISLWGDSYSESGIRSLAANKDVGVLSIGIRLVSEEDIDAIASLENVRGVSFDKSVKILRSELNRLRSLMQGRNVVAGDNLHFLELHRQLAQWALNRGGSVWIDLPRSPSNSQEISDLTNLPDQTFVLTGVDLQGDTTLTDDDLARLQPIDTLSVLRLQRTSIEGTQLGLPGTLKEISASRAPITDEGLRQIAKNRALQKLDLNGAVLTDEGIKALQGLNAINYLAVSGCPIGSSVPSLIENMSRLAHVDFGSTEVDDGTLAMLEGKQQLAYLNVEQTRVSDKGLVKLASLPRLAFLRLTGANVSVEGVQVLQRAAPGCNIEHPSIASDERPDRRAVLEIIRQGATAEITPLFGSMATVAAAPDLPDQPFVLKVASFDVAEDNRQIDLRPLSGLRSLAGVSVRSRDVATRDLDYLASCPVLDRLELDDLTLTIEDAKAIARIPSLRRLVVGRDVLPNLARREILSLCPNLVIENAP